MSWVFTPYAGILWATAFFCAFLAWLIARRKKTEGFLSLELLLGSISLWALASGLEAASVGLGQKLIWARVEYIGAACAPTFFFIFVFSYSLQKHWLEWWSGLLLGIIPFLAILGAWTNGQHGLIWNHFSLSPTEPNTVLYGHGVGFYILLAYDFILVLVSLMLLVRIWLKATASYRRHVTILLAAAFFPILAAILYTTRLTSFPGLDLIPASFLASGVVMAIGISRYQLFDLMPVTSDALIDNMLDGVVVLDAWDRIAKINPFAQRLVSTLSDQSIGQPVAAVLKFWEQSQSGSTNTQETHTEVLLQANPPVCLEVHVSPLLDRRRHFAGRLVIFRDITERYLTKMRLARNVEELQVINRISLVVSAGLDMERILKALFEQCGQVAQVDAFYVALCEPNSYLVNIPIFYEEGRFLTGASRDIRENPGLIGTVVSSRSTLYLRDNDKQTTHPVLRTNALLRRPSRSYIGIPLTVRNQTVGVLSVQNKQPNAYTDDQVRLLERIAMQAAIAIENARLYAQEQRLAIIDELTGIYNYRGLMELGNREIERTRRFNHPLSALFFDIDGFRNLNNTYSHTAGNLVLKAVVDRCSSILRSIDIFVRFGGDEFIVLLPETDVVNAEAVAKRLVDEISASDIPTPYGNLRVSISVGVSSLTDASMDLLTLIERANQAEHHSKKSPLAKVNTAPLN